MRIAFTRSTTRLNGRTRSKLPTTSLDARSFLPARASAAVMCCPQRSGRSHLKLRVPVSKEAQIQIEKLLETYSWCRALLIRVIGSIADVSYDDSTTHVRVVLFIWGLTYGQSSTICTTLRRSPAVDDGSDEDKLSLWWVRSPVNSCLSRKRVETPSASGVVSVKRIDDLLLLLFTWNLRVPISTSLWRMKEKRLYTQRPFCIISRGTDDDPHTPERQDDSASARVSDFSSLTIASESLSIQTTDSFDTSSST